MFPPVKPLSTELVEVREPAWHECEEPCGCHVLCVILGQQRRQLRAEEQNVEVRQPVVVGS